MAFLQFLSDFPAVPILQVGIAIVVIGFGIAKFAHYEQQALVDMVATHPILRAGPRILGDKAFSRLLGSFELLLALLLLIGLFVPTLAVVSGLIGAVMFLATFSNFVFVQYFEKEHGRAFLSFTGQLLIKDLVLLSGCLVVAQYHATQLL